MKHLKLPKSLREAVLSNHKS